MATITQRAKGQWQAKVRKRGYPIETRTFSKKSEAEAWARQTESEMDRGFFLLTSEAEITSLTELISRYQREVAPSPRRQARQQRDRAISEAFDDSKSRDGARRIQAELVDQGMCHDIKTIADSNHTLSVAPNLLDRDFNADAPNQKWAGDITYLYTREGWLYLAVMIDLYSRAVIGLVHDVIKNDSGLSL
ncbi:Uncharacterised protein [BD1-7 clade bacterium]|nr:Uncharacterised protein [BD1-7 clade bacterium]